jgi:hypothetical protein
MQIDRDAFLASQGGASVVNRMKPEAKADALEEYMMQQLTPEGKVPRVADIEVRIEARPFRRGVGHLFVAEEGETHVRRLAPMPAQPTLADFFRLRFLSTGIHVLQSANLAIKNAVPEEIILACLLHDVAQELIKVDHGWWAAQLFEPYVPTQTAFAIRYHQALRFYADEANGYPYPTLYNYVFGEDYKPEPYIEETYKMVRRHKWYFAARQVTINDLYSFDLDVNPSLDQFADVIGRHFRQPKEGLGYDNSPVAHMWRSMIKPDAPL